MITNILIPDPFFRGRWMQGLRLDVLLCLSVIIGFPNWLFAKNFIRDYTYRASEAWNRGTELKY